MPKKKQENWDVFISHASEDKNKFVEPLAELLSRFGIKAWFDKYSLKLGDSLSRSIDQGLAQSRYGVVVLSPSFVSKKWPEYELRGLTARELEEGKVILPIWYQISRKEVLKFSPPLADKFSVVADENNLLKTAVSIVEVIRPDLFTRIMRRIAFHESFGEPVYISADKIRSTGIKHKELPPDLISRIRLVRASVLGVYTHSMEYWIDGFKRDSHPSHEVATWERIGAVYQEFITMTRNLTERQFKQAFELSLALSLTGDMAALKKIADELPKDAFEKICRLHSNAVPAYDINEKLPEEPSIASLYIGDLESFDASLPSDLIGQLVKERKRAKGKA